MVPEGDKNNTFLSNLVLHKKSRGNIFAEKPVFYENGKFLIVSSGRSLHLYDTSTGNHVEELLQCADDIVSYQCDPTDSNSVIAVTENAELVVYNTKTHEVKYSIKLELSQKHLKGQKAPKFKLKSESVVPNFDWETQPLGSLAHRKFLYAQVKAFQNNPSEIFVWATWCLNDEGQSHVSAFTFKKGKHIRLVHLQDAGLQKRSANFVLGTVQGYEVFIGMSKRYVHLVRYDNKKQPFFIRHLLGRGPTITSLAIHPTECCFASGDAQGRIVIWKNIFDRQPLKDLLHWHALPVHGLFFSDFGSYLFSGGEENVLVQWSLNTHTKQFLPRLSSAIYHISGHCESSLLSLSTADNKILIINFNFQNVSTVQHFSRWTTLKGENKLRIFTVDPRSNCFVLNGKTGHIQFLSLNEDGKFIYTFDITNRNFITSDSEQSPIRNTEVTHAKFSKDGKWLITAESRKEEYSCKESRLKFWAYVEKHHSFSLSTNVEFPHAGSEILALEISSDDVVATTGGDQKFRLWSVFSEDVKHKEFWSAYAANRYRNLPCEAVDFSKDASLVAVTFGPALTIWETDASILKCTLSVPVKKDILKFCKFGNNELSHLVVAGSTSSITTWNIITLSVMWTVHLKLTLLISDPFSIYLSAFLSDRSLIIFNPASPTPDLTLKNVCHHPVVAAHCVASEGGKFCLYFVTENQELFCLEDAKKVTGNVSKRTPHSAVYTSYSSQIAEIQSREDFDKNKSVSVNQNNKQLLSNLLNSPAHTLPNPSVLCLDFLRGWLLFSKNQPSAVPSVTEGKNDNTVETAKIPEGCENKDSEKEESELRDILNRIFV